MPKLKFLPHIHIASHVRGEVTLQSPSLLSLQATFNLPSLISSSKINNKEQKQEQAQEQEQEQKQKQEQEQTQTQAQEQNQEMELVCINPKDSQGAWPLPDLIQYEFPYLLKVLGRKEEQIKIYGELCNLNPIEKNFSRTLTRKSTHNRRYRGRG